MNTLTIIYIIVSLIVIIFQYWFIRRQKRTIDFAIYSLTRFARAMEADNPTEEIRRIDWEDEFRSFKQTY